MLKKVHKDKQLIRTEQGTIILTPQNLKTICLIEGLYQYPELNTKLYLHFKSIEKIENLDPYKNIKVLFLQNNLIRKIQNISGLKELESLFLHNNMIQKIQNLDCPKLKIINLSNNQIHIIEGLDNLKELQSLTLNKNFLKSYESISHIKECSDTLTNIDLSDNRIEANEQIIPLFANIKCLYLIGNPFVKDLPSYWRRMVGELTNLVYLDQKGIDSVQRIKAVAWVREGDQGLQKAKIQIQKLKAAQKAQQSKQLMKDIDIHRQRKINLFNSAIEDCKVEIRKYLEMVNRTNMKDFYVSKIEEEQQKINSFYDSIQDLQNRIKKSRSVKQ